MPRVTPTISIDDDELRFEFVRGSGPGGQNVNKVATTAQLRFDVDGSVNLPGVVKVRLKRLAGNKLTDGGEIIIEAKRYRSQQRNRDDAIERLVTLIRRAATPPKPRKKTKPTLASKRRRLESKKRRGDIKQGRQRPADGA
jgi:ribosome-associated protein